MYLSDHWRQQVSRIISSYSSFLPARAAVKPSCALHCLFLCASTLCASGQNNTLVNEGSRPIAGIGHDYIYGVTDTVIPANGSLSLKINLPTPPGRGLSLPFAITYNSGSVHRFSSGRAGCGGLDYFPCNDAIAIDRAHDAWGWSDTLPYATASLWTMISASPLPGPGTSSGCGIESSTNFYDMYGGAHPLGLAFISPPVSYTNGGANACTQLRYGNGSYYYTASASGGDNEVSAKGPYCPGRIDQSTDCSNLHFTVSDLGGTTYFFTGTLANSDPTTASSGAATWYMSPTRIEDRNGNIVTIPAGMGSRSVPGLPITDTLGRTIISASTANGPSVSYPIYGSTSPLSGVHRDATTSLQIGATTYGLSYLTTTASYTSNAKQINLSGGSSSSANCGTTWSISESLSGIRTIFAPNGAGYTFSYEPVYGLVKEIDYPGGGWVKYTWKLSDDFSELATFDGIYEAAGTGSDQASTQVSPGFCNFEYQTPVVETRTVGYSQGSAAEQTQAFSYHTEWNSAGQWTSKVTTVITTDNVTGNMSKTVYTYGPVGRPIQVNEGGSPNAEIPVETNIQYFDLGTRLAPVIRF